MTALVHRIHKVETPGLPLASYQKEAFKLYMLDVGLLSAQAGLSIPLYMIGWFPVLLGRCLTN
jgi:hypothetical protein